MAAALKTWSLCPKVFCGEDLREDIDLRIGYRF
jgi:hypothetical protein